jgi:hypothetical protein
MGPSLRLRPPGAGPGPSGLAQCQSQACRPGPEPVGAADLTLGARALLPMAPRMGPAALGAAGAQEWQRGACIQVEARQWGHCQWHWQPGPATARAPFGSSFLIVGPGAGAAALASSLESARGGADFRRAHRDVTVRTELEPGRHGPRLVTHWQLRSLSSESHWGSSDPFLTLAITVRAAQ